MNRYVYKALCSFDSATGKRYWIGDTIGYPEFKELPYFEQEFFTPLDKRMHEED